MENISKNISLECATNRFFGNYMPALDSETLSAITNVDCWGDFPYDVIIESGDIFDIFSLGGHLPMLCEKDASGNTLDYVFRFGNIAHLYGWLKRIARETVFYKLAIRRGQYKWIEIEQEFFDSGVTFEMYPILPLTSSGEVCEVIAVHAEADKFNNYFRPSGNTARYELNFIGFVKNIFSGAQDYRFRPPYIDITLAITEDANSVGDLLCDEQVWRENKKYYVGDIVRYEEDYYTLEHGEYADKFKVTGDLYDIVNQDFISWKRVPWAKTIYNFINEIPDNLDNLSREKLNILYDDTVSPTDFDIVQAFYKGEYDPETRLTNFDDEGHSHWSKIEPRTEGGEEEDTDIIILSSLDVFRSVRKSYDIYGQELPFNVIESDDTPLVALIYSLGYTNYSIKDNGACADFLKEVTFMQSLSDSGDTITFDGTHKDIIISDRLNDNCSYIRFSYYCGCNVVDSGDTQFVDEKTGVHYEETRRIEIITEKYKYYGEDTETEFTYFKLSNLSEESKSCKIDKACAKVVYNTRVVDTIPLHVFSNSRLFGSTFVEHGRDELQISRGTYAAFERHNILGEINSMDDLKNYRNNYFKL